MKTRDLSGARFGRLVATSLDSIRNQHAYWHCRCDCGRETVVRGNALTSGHTVSCGCHRADPAIRQAARWQLSAKHRKLIARMGGKAAARAAQGGAQ
jgi:hypothetical protein